MAGRSTNVAEGSSSTNGATKATQAKPTKAKFLGNLEIPLTHIHGNPLNPRKGYHFASDNLHINQMADSLALSGQHNPLKVYELLPEEPGYYVVVQGHRRLYAATQAGLETLECIVVSRPSSRLEELKWLGSEDSLRDEWGPFSAMEYARDLAAAYQYPPGHVATAQLVADTGLSMAKLSIAEKMFRLEPAIYAHVKRWEEYQYFKRLADDLPLAGDFSSDSGIRIIDFSPEKAAITWDIFEALRTNVEAVVADWGDLALQQRIAQLASRASLKDMEKFKIMINTLVRNPRAGSHAQIVGLLQDKSHVRGVETLIRTTRNTYVIKLVEGTKVVSKVAALCELLGKNVDQLGYDLEVLRSFDNALLLMLRSAERFEAKLTKVIRQVEREDQL